MTVLFFFALCPKFTSDESSEVFEALAIANIQLMDGHHSHSLKESCNTVKQTMCCESCFGNRHKFPQP